MAANNSLWNITFHPYYFPLPDLHININYIVRALFLLRPQKLVELKTATVKMQILHDLDFALLFRWSEQTYKYARRFWKDEAISFWKIGDHDVYAMIRKFRL